ncbi:MAG TPA: hypothetical protein VH397_08240 [Xanthobacteraceae bacterium]
MGHQRPVFTARARIAERGTMVGRVALLIVLGALVAGCDKCGDWWSPLRGGAQACREQAPRPQ